MKKNSHVAVTAAIELLNITKTVFKIVLKR